MTANNLNRPYGSVVKTACPVCDSLEIENAWKIPMTTIDPPAVLFGGYFNQVPTLQSPFTLYCFDFCRSCESIFLNPDIPRQNQIDTYRRSTHYVKKMENKNEWRGYVERYDMMKRHLPEKAESFIDAACGLGQLAILAQNDKSHRWVRIAALELSAAYVKHLTVSGIEAYEFDIDSDSIEQKFERDSVDFIAFFEAFEHVRHPLQALEKLISVLRPGGRIFFSAQRYGPDVNLAIRPGEPIYIGEKFVEDMDDRLNCDTVDVVRSGSRYFIVLEKRRSGKAKAISNEITLKPPFRHDTGHCWTADLEDKAARKSALLRSICDTEEFPTRSNVRLTESSGKFTAELGMAHAAHAQIRGTGKGQFSHWKTHLYFSTSDNSDPNSNGRQYTIVLDPLK